MTVDGNWCREKQRSWLHMWHGKDTPELIELKKQYRQMFGYSPDGERGVSYGDRKRYIQDIKESIKTGEHIVVIAKRR